ncbi:unnamed protein product [Symbiodinium sp. CCMP2592]|nr:unnamed protein product [Symbiodinium sp. CCMP2592]
MKKPSASAGHGHFIRCSKDGCTSTINCKNSRHSLARKAVQLDRCRVLRKDCNVIKFCCKQHLEDCQKVAKKAKPKSRTDEALNAEQFAALFLALCDCGFPWAGVLILIQLFLGDRADCSRSCRVSWLVNVLSAGADVAGLPAICIPDNVNGKTVGGQRPLDKSFARLLRDWVEKEPLMGAKGSQWPLKNQDFSAPDACLFPGTELATQRHAWERPISERAYFGALRKAVDSIAVARKHDEDHGRQNIFAEVDLAHIGTHTVKKTCVSLLAEAGATMAVISSITNTSVAVLKKHYDVPTNLRKRRAIDCALGPVIAGLVQQDAAPGPSRPAAGTSQAVDESARWCPFCGKQLTPGWIYCHFCGAKLPTQ